MGANEGAAGPGPGPGDFVVRGPRSGASLWTQVRRWLVPLASLRLTVWLLAMSIFIVLAGTLAQTQADVWVVVRDYFRTAIAWIPLQVFFPKSFFPNLPEIPGMIPFPGGWLIGVLMALNLVAAHTVRFTAQARGGMLALGLGVLALGVVLTFMVVMGGSGSGLQAEPVVSWQATWNLCKLLLALAGVGLIVATLRTGVGSTRMGMVGLVTGGLLELLAVGLFALGDRVALGDSSMRILWQLIQGGMAGAVLLVGCWIVFGRRAGIVLLHAGIALLMFSELLVGLAADEAQMHIKEGETVNYVQDIREVELAIVERSNPTAEETVVIPQSRLQEAFQSLQHPFLPRWFTRKLPEGIRGLVGCSTGSPLISDPALPFDVRVVNYLQNSKLGQVGGESGKEKNPANRGLGLQAQATEVMAATGVKSEAVDDSSVYVEFLEKGKSEPQSLGIWLCSLFQTRLQDSRERSGWNESEVREQTPPFLYMLSVPQEVESGGRKYQFALRFKRTYKPYRVKLDDVRFDKYLGTNTAKNYSSDIVLTDGSASVPRHIWMNNPLRYGGETFYQSNYMPDVLTGEEMTGLQVVTNTGWMIPYVSCMIVAVGMLFQFGATLGRFLAKASTPVALAKESLLPPRAPLTTLDWVLGGLAVLACLALTASYLGKSDRSSRGFDFDAAGRLPIAYQGRVKPLDTLARNALQVISNGETLRDHTINQKLTATQWLFEIMSGVSDEKRKRHEDPPPPPRHGRYRVFRIDNLEVLDFFKLEKRAGFLYSLEEIGAKAREFNAEVDKIRELKTMEGLGIFQRKMLDLDRRVRTFTALERSLRREEM
ncbi:MAG: cytochrome c biogenesis protein ResB, partial [Planctomycetaceae bacterium]